MELWPVAHKPNKAVVIIETADENRSLSLAALRNTSLLFSPLGAHVASKLIRTPDMEGLPFPHEVTLSRWELAFVAHGLNHVIRQSRSTELALHELTLQDAIQQAGFAEHWTTPIISRHS